MKEALVILLTVLGGLGIFLLGMKHLSEGLQAAASGGLRRFMAHATKHRLYGVGTGIVSTIIVQSSSIITVMLVGFVSTALMTLPQAFAVLIGANIGTTATVWIIAYAPDPQMLGFTGLAVGGTMYFFLRGERVHHLGLTVIGLGLVFLGLYFMSKGVMPIRENPEIARAFQSMSAATYLGVFEVAAAAALLTAVVQSSAATIAIAMTLAAQQLISYEVAIAVLFGANVGTTATGWLAAIGGTADAKRTALSHTLSNLAGSFALVWFFPLFVRMGQALFPDWNAVSTTTVSGQPVEVLTCIMAPIAVTDTVFAVCRGLIFFPIVRPFCRFIERLVKQPENEKPHLSSLRIGAKVSPVIACDQALSEVDFMKTSNIDLLKCVRAVLAGEADEQTEKHIVHREEILDNVQKEVTEFLGGIMSKRLSIDVAERAQRLLRLTDELESISDECAQVLKVVKRLRKQRERMSDVSLALLLTVHDRITGFAAEVTGLIRSPRGVIPVEALQAESKELHEFVRECRRKQLGRVGPEDPGSSVRVLCELDIINAYERVRAYYLNCAETLAGGKKTVFLTIR
ncbi:MAG: Na/Pi cotransporter family protein [Kiritimatiellae bacterium]|nr:Na/Pi cotransporter family protein [Kiritimatiellia bacterium]